MTLNDVTDELDRAMAALSIPHLRRNDITIGRLMKKTGRTRDAVRNYLRNQVARGALRGEDALDENGQRCRRYVKA